MRLTFCARVRRVKCDEEKPSCRRCIGSGRVCNGYGIWGGGTSPSQPTSKQQYILQVYRSQALQFYQDPAPFPGVPRKEQLYFEYFCKAPTLKLAGIFESDFWGSLVVQASTRESAVRHATIALASAHRSHLTRCEGGNLRDVISDDSFALLQYNRAIEDLNAQTSQDPHSLRVAAVACVVFVCLEMLRGEYDAMGTHFRHGMNLIRQMQSRDKKHGIFVRQDPQSLDDHLAQMFSLLNLFPMLGHGSQQKDIFVQDFYWGRGINIPRLFSTVSEMRQPFDSIFNSISYLISQVEKSSIGMDEHQPPLTPTLVQQQRELQAALSDWIAVYDASVPSLLSRVSSYEILGLRMLRIYGNLATIMLCTCFSIKETTFDSHTSTFESIIAQSEKLAILSGYAPVDADVDTETSSFSVDIGCFPPLYYTALKCRVPHLRRRAVKLLQRTRHTEGPWNGPLLARIATQVIDMEEKDFSAALHASPLLYKHSTGTQKLSNTSDLLTTPPSTTDNETPPPMPPLSPTSPPSIPFSLPEFSRLHCVRCVPPPKIRPFIPIDSSGNRTTFGTLICSRFQHELGKNGGGKLRHLRLILYFNVLVNIFHGGSVSPQCMHRLPA